MEELLRVVEKDGGVVEEGFVVALREWVKNTKGSP